MTNEADVEATSSVVLNSLNGAVPGYPRLGSRMGLVPEMAIFRRFGALNAQMLLYMQADIIHIEEQLRKIEIQDSKSKEDYKYKYARDCWFLFNPETNNDRQLQLVTDLKAKLKEYSKSIFPEKTGVVTKT